MDGAPRPLGCLLSYVDASQVQELAKYCFEVTGLLLLDSYLQLESGPLCLQTGAGLCGLVVSVRGFVCVFLDD